MTAATVIRLPVVPPSVNSIWRHGKSRSGKPVTYLNPIYKRWRDAAWPIAFSQLHNQPRWRTPVNVVIAMRCPRKGSDVDNRIKGCADILQSVAIITNDNLIRDIRAYWSDDVEGVEITITATDTEAAT